MFRLLNQLIVFFGGRLGSVEHHQNQVGVGQRLQRFSYADGFRFIQSMPNPSRIDELQRDAAERNSFTDQIARGARRCGNDGAFAFHQSIE